MREKQSYWHSEEAGVYCGLCGKESSALKSRLVRNTLVEMPYGCKGHEDRCLQDLARKVVVGEPRRLGQRW